MEGVLARILAATVLAAGAASTWRRPLELRPGLVEAVAGLVPGGSTVFLDNEALPGGLAGLGGSRGGSVCGCGSRIALGLRASSWLISWPAT
ncbi:hypothetical protein [Pyrodictium abyssi]|uniref:Uncharacterized protein n=1 Tax=Pyrodictium abyssi TaxID=54256 RepID=A0ABN6ZJP8_9CREN|nr:hypothetical protein PABY_00440 [Pyrodictium abyssi]